LGGFTSPGGIKLKKSKEIKIDNIIIKNKRIDFSKNFKFKNIILNNYNSFFKILEIAQQKNLDIHPKAVRFILDNIKRVKNKISGKKEFLLSFLKILTSKNNTEKFLKLMSDLGLLGILIPDFKRVSGQIQFGGFHTYTVDEHTLKAIGYINDMQVKKNIKENLLYNKIFSEIISSKILYIAMFFHDLGKGTGYDHSIVSTKIAKKFCSFIKIDLNAIAKGFGVDVVCSFLESIGMNNIMVEIGGEVRTKGKNLKNEPWIIAVETPDHESAGSKTIRWALTLENKAMATSGDYRNYYEIDGIRYSHEIDPRTGYPSQTGVASATVVASNCMDADALATTLIIMGAKSGLQLIEKLDGVEAFLIMREGNDNYRTIKSSGMKISTL